MPTHQVQLIPGVNTNKTPSLNEAAYQTTQLIRWDPGSGLAQKLGGWDRFYQFPIASEVTALHAWEDLSGVLHLAIGAQGELDVLTGDVLDNITPELTVTNPAVNFSTVMGSQIVTVIDPGSNATPFDVIILETPVSIGGIILSGPYQVLESIDSDTYTISASVPAVSTVNNGGAVPTFTTVSGSPEVTVVLDDNGQTVGSTFPITLSTMVGGITLFGFYTVSSVTDANTFVIIAANQASSNDSVSQNSGNAQILYYVTNGPPALGIGYGVGGYGEGGYGDGVPPPPHPGTPITVIDYTLDNFGGTLIASPNDGPIFTWQPESGLLNAQMIATAPTVNTGVFVSGSAQILIAYGSSVLGVQDPLLVNWSNAGDYTDWTATVGNLAGEFRLSTGSRIVGGLQGPQYDILWTDLDVRAMSFIGSPLAYSFTQLATGCGLIGKFAAGVLGTTVFWMSQKQFFALPAGGSVTPVPCTVWDFIFQNLDTANVEKIRCAPNSQFGEVTWYFPVAGGDGKNSAYVKFTPQFSAWDYGFLGRSAWIDQSGLGPPIGADSESNLIFQHETSNDADGQALDWSTTTGYWALSDGQDQIFCDLVLPDFKWGQFDQAQTASVNLSFTYADYPVGVSYTTPTYVMSNSGQSFINVRFRGRLASMSVSGNDTGSFVRMGGPRIRTASDGRL